MCNWAVGVDPGQMADVKASLLVTGPPRHRPLCSSHACLSCAASMTRGVGGAARHSNNKPVLYIRVWSRTPTLEG